jgi:hypothetical protein
MPVETASDRAALLADFGVQCVWTPSGGDPATITGIFDNEYLQAEAGGTQGFAMRSAKVLVRTSDIPGAADGDAMTIDGNNYILRIVMPDGTGMTDLFLEAQ